MSIVPILLIAMPNEVRACGSTDDLSWMLGHWEARGERSIDVEAWTRVSDQTIEGWGRSFAIPEFRETFHESMRLATMSGEVFFTAKVPGNDNAVSFKMTSCSENSAVFENPKHDFPTRLAYRLAEDKKLNVDVRGPDGKGFIVEYTRSDSQRRMALTFDDAPRNGDGYLGGEERARTLIESLNKAGSPPVIFFSTTRGMNEEGAARMRAYQQAGHFIGNHTHTHQRIDSLGVDKYIDDIRAAHQILSEFENFVPLFRFPFLDEGRDLQSRDRLREALQSMGYSNGYVTVDNYDFFIESLFQRAIKKERSFDRVKLGQAYVESLMESVRFYADIGERYLDHSPGHVLLLHENDLAAMYIGDLIRALRAEGWTLVDAREAYKDPIASIIPDTLFNGQGRVAAIAHSNGAAREDLVHRAEDEAYLEQYLEEREVFGALAVSPEGQQNAFYADGCWPVYAAETGCQ